MQNVYKIVTTASRYCILTKQTPHEFKWPKMFPNGFEWKIFAHWRPDYEKKVNKWVFYSPMNWHKTKEEQCNYNEKAGIAIRTNPSIQSAKNQHYSPKLAAHTK